jgi:hypothetical protein
MGEVIRLDVWNETTQTAPQAAVEAQPWQFVPESGRTRMPLVRHVRHPRVVQVVIWICSRIIGLVCGRTLLIPGLSEELGSRLERLSAVRGTPVETIVLESLDASLSADHRRRRLARHATWAASDRSHLETALACQRGIDEELWS